jgi:DNA-binding PadR family transcriptional regulator
VIHVIERDLVLLGVLRQGAMHGYRIAEIVEKELGEAVDLKRSTTYYLLERLAKDGYLHRDRVPAGKRPTRYVYELTERGEQRFFELLRQNLQGSGDVRFGGDAGLAFLDALDPSEASALLTRRRAALEDALTAVASEQRANDGSDLLLAHQASFLSEEIDWVEHVIGRLRSGPRRSSSKGGV